MMEHNKAEQYGHNVFIWNIMHVDSGERVVKTDKNKAIYIYSKLNKKYGQSFFGLTSLNYRSAVCSSLL